MKDEILLDICAKLIERGFTASQVQLVKNLILIAEEVGESNVTSDPQANYENIQRLDNANKNFRTFTGEELGLKDKEIKIHFQNIPQLNPNKKDE